MKINNKEDLAVGDLQGELLERKPLPIGKTQFMEWSDRIIKGSLIDAGHESLRFALASMVMHMGPTEAFREDAFFILQLRKAAVNQTSYAIMEELKEKQKLDKSAEETAPLMKVATDGLLENQKV